MAFLRGWCVAYTLLAVADSHPPLGRAPIRVGVAAPAQVASHARLDRPPSSARGAAGDEEERRVRAHHPYTPCVLNSSLLPTHYSSIVRSMISRHPFNRWPLHVKLFTEEAVNHWAASARMPNVAPLPPGFTCAVELEGVDGKSGYPGSGRTGPIEVGRWCARAPYIPTPAPRSPVYPPAEFTAALLAKNTALLASGLHPDCTVCHAPLDMHASVSTPDPSRAARASSLTAPSPGQNALSTALCPHRRVHRGVAPRVPRAELPRGGGRRGHGVHPARRALRGVRGVHAVGRRRARVLPPPPAQRAGRRGHRERRHVRLGRGARDARAAQGGRSEVQAEAPWGDHRDGQQRGRVV